VKRYVEVKDGERTVLGTQFPIVSFVEKSGSKSKPWRATYGLCNGVPTSSEDFATLGEAKEAIGATPRKG